MWCRWLWIVEAEQPSSCATCFAAEPRASIRSTWVSRSVRPGGRRGPSVSGEDISIISRASEVIPHASAAPGRRVVATGSPAAGGSASDNASAEATKSFAAGSGKGSKFCNELGVIAAQEAKLDPSSDTPADTKKAFDEIKSLKGPLEGSAPSSIKGDLSTMFDYIAQLDGVLAKAGYDWTKINPTDLATFEADSQKFETASQNVDNYVSQACGIDTGDDASPSS